MTSPLQTPNHEPTLLDAIQIMQTGFRRVDEQFDGLGNRITTLENRMDRLENDMGAGFVSLNHRMGSLEVKVEDMHETMLSMGRAVDSDAITIVDHERRITTLETRPS